MDNQEFAWKLKPAIAKAEKEAVEWLIASEKHLRELLAKVTKENAELRERLDRIEKKLEA